MSLWLCADTNFSYEWSNTPPLGATIDTAALAATYDYDAIIQGRATAATSDLPADLMHTVKVNRFRGNGAASVLTACCVVIR